MGAPRVRLQTTASGLTGLGAFGFANAEDGYLSTNNLVANGNGTTDLYWTADGGRTWRQVDLGGRLVARVVASGRHAYALATTCPASVTICPSYELASASVTGANWSRKDLNLPRFANASLAAFDSNVWIVFSHGGPPIDLLVSEDAGRTFSSPSNTGLSAVACEISASSRLIVWAFCPTGMMGFAVKSNDGGRHFVQIGGSAVNSSYVVPFSDAIAVYITYGQAFLTTDGGKTLNPMDLPGLQGAPDVVFANRRLWVALGVLKGMQSDAQALWRTTNGGNTWVRASLPTLHG